MTSTYLEQKECTASCVFCVSAICNVIDQVKSFQLRAEVEWSRDYLVRGAFNKFPDFFCTGI